MLATFALAFNLFLKSILHDKLSGTICCCTQAGYQKVATVLPNDDATISYFLDANHIVRINGHSEQPLAFLIDSVTISLWHV